MGKHTRKPRGASENGRSHLGKLIHAAVRGAIEAAVEADSTPQIDRRSWGHCAIAGSVPALDGVEDSEARLGRGREALPIEHLALEGREEEALAERVVVDIAHRAHRGA
jgi:hypothetical protein